MDATSPNEPVKANDMTNSKSSKPTHNVFFVREGKKGGRGFWTRIGAAWMHDDKKGLSLAIDLLPAGNAEGKIVIRVDEPKANGETATEGQGEPA